METMQGALKNGRNVWDPINMPPSEFEGRIASVRAAMRQEGIDLLLVYGFAFNRYADPAYLTNFIIRLPRGTLIALPSGGQPALFFEGGSRGIPSLRKTAYDSEIVAAADNAKDCVKYLKAKNLLGGRIGFAGLRESMPYGQIKLLEEALAGSTVVDAGGIVRGMRTVKSGHELDEIRRAGRIVREVFGAVPAFTTEGATEKGVAALLFRQARTEGVEDMRILFGRKNRDAWYLRPASDRTISRGETVSVYVAVEFERYWAEAARPFVMEAASLASVEGGLDELYGQAAEVIKPGVAASEVYGSVQAIAARTGIELIPDYGVGQGVGLSPHEAPEIAAEDGTRLAPGMSLALRLVAKDGAAGAVMRGGTIIVTAGGREVLV